MYDLECPYCKAECDVCHDDGFGYAEDTKHEMECHACGKNFVFTTAIHFTYRASRADCLNGNPHELAPVCSTARDIWPNWVRCKNCDYEDRGAPAKQPAHTAAKGGINDK